VRYLELIRNDICLCSQLEGNTFVCFFVGFAYDFAKKYEVGIVCRNFTSKWERL